MKKATLIRTLGVLGALLAAYLLAQIVTYVARPLVDSGGALGAAIDQIRNETLTGAVIVGPAGDSIALRREGNAWTVNGLPADSAAIARLMAGARAAKLGDRVAKTSVTHRQLGVASDSTRVVEIRSARGTVRLFLGAAGATTVQRGYVRLPGQDVVYEVLGSLHDALVIPLAQWRDKTVLRADTASIRVIAVERGSSEFAVERGDRGWHERGAVTAAEHIPMDALLAELARFNVREFLSDTVKFRGSEMRRVVALGARGDTVAAIDLAGDPTKWLVRIRGSRETYEAANLRADRVAPRRAEVLRVSGAGK